MTDSLSLSTDASSGHAKTALSRLLRIAATEGMDVDAFARDHNIDSQLLTVRGNPLDRPKYLHAITKLIQTLDIPDLGFRSGERFTLGDLGVLGHAILSSKDIGEALSIYVDFRRAFGSVFDVQLAERDDSLVVSTRLDVREASLQRYLLENWLLALPSLSSLVPDSDEIFDSVSLPYPEPVHGHLYQEVFNCPVFFDRPQTEVILDAEIARSSLKYSNPVVHSFCKNECLKAIKALKGQRRLDELIREILLNANHDFPTPLELSRKLNMSERTLRRRLADGGTSYNKLLLEVRMQLASEYQSEGDRSIKDIALSLGYKDVASYHRAFKSYFGITPKRYC